MKWFGQGHQASWQGSPPAEVPTWGPHVTRLCPVLPSAEARPSGLGTQLGRAGTAATPGFFCTLLRNKPKGNSVSLYLETGEKCCVPFGSGGGLGAGAKGLGSV